MSQLQVGGLIGGGEDGRPGLAVLPVGANEGCPGAGITARVAVERPPNITALLRWSGGDPGSGIRRGYARLAPSPTLRSSRE